MMSFRFSLEWSSLLMIDNELSGAMLSRDSASWSLALISFVSIVQDELDSTIKTIAESNSLFILGLFLQY